MTTLAGIRRRAATWPEAQSILIPRLTIHFRPGATEWGSSVRASKDCGDKANDSHPPSRELENSNGGEERHKGGGCGNASTVHPRGIQVSRSTRLRVDSYVHKVGSHYVRRRFMFNRQTKIPIQLPGVSSGSFARSVTNHIQHVQRDWSRIFGHAQSHGKSASSTLVQVKYPIPPPSRPTSSSR